MIIEAEAPFTEHTKKFDVDTTKPLTEEHEFLARVCGICLSFDELEYPLQAVEGEERFSITKISVLDYDAEKIYVSATRNDGKVHERVFINYEQLQTPDQMLEYVIQCFASLFWYTRARIIKFFEPL